MNSKWSCLLAISAAALAAAAPAAADWWYAVYAGDKHIGYRHVVESSATLGGAVVTRYTAVTEARRDKVGRYTFKKTADRYIGAEGIVYYAATITKKDKVTTIKSSKTADGFTITVTKGDKGEIIKVAAADFDLIEAAEALAKLTAPGSKLEARALDLETGKVRKTKVEYVADQTLEVAGESVPVKVLQAKGGLGGATYWFGEDGAVAKYEGDSSLGKITTVLTSAAGARP